MEENEIARRVLFVIEEGIDELEQLYPLLRQLDEPVSMKLSDGFFELEIRQNEANWFYRWECGFPMSKESEAIAQIRIAIQEWQKAAKPVREFLLLNGFVEVLPWNFEKKFLRIYRVRHKPETWYAKIVFNARRHVFVGPRKAIRKGLTNRDIAQLMLILRLQKTTD